MKSVQIEFTPAEARRLESIARRDRARSLSQLVKRAAMEYVRFAEKERRGHFPDEKPPSAYRIPTAGCQPIASADSPDSPSEDTLNHRTSTRRVT